MTKTCENINGNESCFKLCKIRNDARFEPDPCCYDSADMMQLQHARTLSEVGHVPALQDTRLQTTVSHVVVCECHRYCKCQFGTTCNSSFLHSWPQSENNSLGL